VIPLAPLKWSNAKEWVQKCAYSINWTMRESLGPAETGTCWDDLRFPATAINPPGVAADPDIDTTFGTFLFAVNEVIFLIAQMPHSWKEGSDIVPHVHWYKTTSADGDVNWQLDYRWAPIGEVFASSWTTLNVQAPVPGTPDTDTANKHLLSSFGAVSASGKTLSDMLLMKLTRVAATGTEYGADAGFFEFDIHFQSDSRGSAQEFVKSPV
jgi:hypothetical protein